MRGCARTGASRGVVDGAADSRRPRSSGPLTTARTASAEVGLAPQGATTIDDRHVDHGVEVESTWPPRSSRRRAYRFGRDETVARTMAREAGVRRAVRARSALHGSSDINGSRRGLGEDPASPSTTASRRPLTGGTAQPEGRVGPEQRVGAGGCAGLDGRRDRAGRRHHHEPRGVRRATASKGRVGVGEEEQAIWSPSCTSFTKSLADGMLADHRQALHLTGGACGNGPG